MTSGRFAVSLVLLLTAIGCKSSPISLQPEERVFTHDSYPAVYKAWTRSKETFKWIDLSHLLYVTATFESWEFRWAYAMRYAYDYSLEPEARDEILYASQRDSQKEHRFFVSLVGFSYQESDLSNIQSAWRVLLIGPDGRQMLPTTVERIRRPTPLEQVYFPSVSPFRHAFRLSFPAVDENGQPTISENADHLILRFTGVRGRVDLRWDFNSPSQS